MTPEKKKHKPNSRSDEAEGTSSYAHEMPGSSNQNISRERERKIDGTKPGLVGQGGQEQKLGVYFAPVIPCSTPKTNDLTNPALYKDCVIHNSQEKEAFFVQREDLPLLKADGLYVYTKGN